MPSYNASQRQAIAQFVSFTQSKESIAGRLLKTHGWNVEQAVDAFYQSGSATASGNAAPAQHMLGKLFDQYRDQKNEPDRIGIDGAQRYLSDLGIGLDEVATLALFTLLECPSIGEFSREKFVDGWKSASAVGSPGLTCDTLPKQQQYITTIRKRLTTDTSYFKDVYRSTFRLAKPENQKSVPMESALDFWRLFFGGKEKGGIKWDSAKTPWLEWWLEFYETKNKRPVNKDLWNMMMELVSKTQEPGGEDLEWWSEDGAWPMAVDEFVEFVKEKRGSADGRADHPMDIS